MEAFVTANFLSNLLPTTTLQKNLSPYEALWKKSLDDSSLWVFRCACYPNLRDYAKKKLIQGLLNVSFWVIMTNIKDIDAFLQLDEYSSVDMSCLMRKSFLSRMFINTCIQVELLLLSLLGNKDFKIYLSSFLHIPILNLLWIHQRLLCVILHRCLLLQLDLILVSNIF